MNLPAWLETPIFWAERARSLGFTAESVFFRVVSQAFPGKPNNLGDFDAADIALARKALLELLRRDAANITQGLYPASVLKPEPVWDHLTRIPRLLWDGVRISWRRDRGRTTVFSREAKELLAELPKYYQRNFHFQTDGYLSEDSARLYDHQVEILFGGGADAMRRLILPELKRHFAVGPESGLQFLELAAGTGRASRFVKLAFPKAHLTVTDISGPYLKVARSRLQDQSRLSVLEARAEQLPFKDASFDAVYSVFLFHELPREQRLAVLREGLRVLKPGGFFGLVDSIQLGDVTELDRLLGQFPEEYHEPFFRDYITNPIEALIREAGLEPVRSSTGFFSKVVAARRPLIAV